MWQIENRTPFAAERGWVRDRDGAEIWLVALKCTFDIASDGTLQVSEDQPPVLRAPEWNGEPGQSSIKYESDLVLRKRTTDIYVVGHARAPRGQPVHQIDVGFCVGPVRKIIRVFGDRIWDGLGPSPSQHFIAVPLVYERAFGGTDRRSATPETDWEWRNPVGTGFAVTKENIKGLRVANCEYPSELISAWNDRPEPAGLGAIAGHWQPRAGHAGTYDDRWMSDRQPLLPDDFDDRFFQCAPVDQQSPAFLHGGEPVVLLGMRDAGALRFQLPRVFPGFETVFFDGTRELHKNRSLHTVILEPDLPRVSLVWHTSLPCHSKVQKLDRTIIALKEDVGFNSEQAVDGLKEG